MLMMMMNNGETIRSHPTVQVPPCDLFDDPTAYVSSINLNAASSPNGDNVPSPFDSLTALYRYLPSNTANNFVATASGDDDDFDPHGGEDFDIPVDAFSCDHFRMYEFKVRRCTRGRSHDWTECPFAHPGEKARRRDPRKHHYSGAACPEFRKGHCRKGDACEFAHGVFECWLHPARYRTQPCKDGTHCRRRVCFFAHTPDQLRVLPQTSPRINESYDGSPGRLALDSFYSPPVSPPYGSPPMSPSESLRLNSINSLAAAVGNLQIGKVGMSMSPPAWGTQMGLGYGFSSPRNPTAIPPRFLSLPSTPTRMPARSGLGVFDKWDRTFEEEPLMERVESGRDLRAQIYARLSEENSFDRADSSSLGPDVTWISELVK